MSVHYKFKSGKEAHTITFDSLHISLGELKKAIMQQQKIGKSADLDLEITNAQTKEVYKNNSTLIPKNTSVIVARVPVTNSNYKKPWNKNNINLNKNIATNKTDNSISSMGEKGVASATINSEEDKIKEMLTQSTKDYDPSKYARGRGPMGPLPPNYTCYRCGKPGHYIKHCPTNNIDVKRSTGIPRSFMIPAGPEQKGAMITANGEYAVPIIDHDAYKEVRKEKPPFSESENESADNQQSKIEIPEELQCSLCKNLLQDAVLVPCCGNSFCDECIRLLLLDSDNHECPSCYETNVSPDNLIPNRYLRISVDKFKKETGYASNLLKKTENKTSAVVVKRDEKDLDSQQSSKDDSQVKTEVQDQEDNVEKKSSIVDDSRAVESTLDQAPETKDLSEKDNENDKKTNSRADNGNKDIDNDESIVSKKKEENDFDEEKSSFIDKKDNDKKSENPIPTTDAESPPLTTNATINKPNHLPVIGGCVLPPPPPFGLNFPNSRFRNQMQISVRSSGGQSSMFPQQSMLRMPPRLANQNRNLLSDSAVPFFPDPTSMSGFGPIGLPPLPPPPPPPPYGYSSQIRNSLYDNMYNHHAMNNRTGTINPMHMPPYPPNNLNPLGSLNGRTMPSLMGDGENPYYPSSSSSYKYHDDYEDKLERFNRQLESRSRRYRDGTSNRNDRRRERDHSRSRSPHSSRHSRSRSVSSSSSHSSLRSHRSRHRDKRSQSRHYESSRDRRHRERSPRTSHSPSLSSYRFVTNKSYNYSSHRHRKSRSHSKHDKRGEYRERSRERYDRDKSRHKSSSSSYKRESSYNSSRVDKDESKHRSDKYVSIEDEMTMRYKSRKNSREDEMIDFDGDKIATSLATNKSAAAETVFSNDSNSVNNVNIVCARSDNDDRLSGQVESASKQQKESNLIDIKLNDGGNDSRQLDSEKGDKSDIYEEKSGDEQQKPTTIKATKDDLNPSGKEENKGKKDKRKEKSKSRKSRSRSLTCSSSSSSSSSSSDSSSDYDTSSSTTTRKEKNKKNNSKKRKNSNKEAATSNNKSSKHSTMVEDYDSTKNKLKNKTKYESKSKSNDYGSSSSSSKSKNDKSSAKNYDNSKHDNKGLKQESSNRSNKKSKEDESQIKKEAEAESIDKRQNFSKEGITAINNNERIDEKMETIMTMVVADETALKKDEEQYSINEHQVEELDQEEKCINNKNLSEDLSLPPTKKTKTATNTNKKNKNTTTKLDEVEIKIQEDYSDLESEDVAVMMTNKKTMKKTVMKPDERDQKIQSSNTTTEDNKEIINLNNNKTDQDEEDGIHKSDHHHAKIVKTNEHGKLLVSFSITKRSDDDSDRKHTKAIISTSPTKSRENKVNESSKLKSKISLKDKDKEKEKDRGKSSSKHSLDHKKDRDKNDRSKEKKRDKSKDRHHKDHHASSSLSNKVDSKLSSKSSKDKKKDKEERRSHKHHSSSSLKKRNRKHRSRSRSESSDSSDDGIESPIIKKKIRSAIDSSFHTVSSRSSSSKHKSSSSKSYRK